MDLANGRRPSSRRARRAGRDQGAETAQGTSTEAAAIEREHREEEMNGPTPTVREVRILGLDRRPRGAAWSAGREIQWLGRDYVVVATADRTRSKSSAEPALHYVHLTGPSAPPENDVRKHERNRKRERAREQSRRGSAGALASSPKSTALVVAEARGR